jgi:hypothetical protein
MTNEEIILNHKNNKKSFDETEVLFLMELARKYGQKDVRYKAIEILEETLKSDVIASKYFYAETCIKEIQNINV